MKADIVTHLNDPRQLEKMYRANKGFFKQEFNALYPELRGNALADFWYERLNYDVDEIKPPLPGELLVVVIAAVVAGLIAKLPTFFPVNEEFFYSRNVGFIIFPVLSAYFAWRNRLSIGKIIMMLAAMLAGLIFINLLPDNQKSDTLILACIHLPLFLWSMLGFAFAGGNYSDHDARLRFLTYNGDLIVITTLIVIAGMIMSGVTIGLFSLIGFNIERFYFENVVVFGLPAAPIVGTYLTCINPQLVGKVSPVIARIFSPIVLIMLVIYLVAMVYAGKDPYNDREFLMMFNLLLIGVMAIIFFSAADLSKTTRSTLELWVLFLLSAITVVVNGIALSAIVFRISEWGITPNRMAVLGGNVLMLINLLLVTKQLFGVVFKNTELPRVGKAIAVYLPVYILWTIIVTFLFPLLFGFR